MPTRTALEVVADQLADRVKKHGVHTMSRGEITTMIRTASGDDRARYGRLVGADLTEQLGLRGIICFPNIVDIGSGDAFRMYPARTGIGHLVDLILHPSTDGDREIAEAIKSLNVQASDGEPQKRGRGRPRKQVAV